MRSNLRFSEVSSSLELPSLPELSDLPVGVSRTRSPKHLTVGSDPLVGDPLGPDQHRTAPMFDKVVVASILVHVPPEHHTPLHWPHESPDHWEDRVASSGNMREITHQCGKSVSSVDVEQLPSLQGTTTDPHQNLNTQSIVTLRDREISFSCLVIVRDVLPGQSIVRHLVQLRGRGGGRVQVEEMINSSGNRGVKCQIFVPLPGC